MTLRTRITGIVVAAAVVLPLAGAVGSGHAAAPPLGAGVRISKHAETGLVRFIGAPRSRPIERPAGITADSTPEAAARAFLGLYGSLFGIENQSRDLQTAQSQAASGDRTVVKFQQKYQGVPVLGGELVVQLTTDRNVIAATGEILPEPSIDVTPTVDAASAGEAAIEAVAKAHGVAATDLDATAPKLWIYDSRLLGGPGLGRPTLVWRTEVTPESLGPIRELVLVDATLGVVALHFNQAATLKDRKTYTANNGTVLPGTLLCSEASAFPACAGGDLEAEGAHRYAGDTYDFYADRFGRDGIDDAGGALISTVHYDSGYANAFWNGTQMVYGDAKTNGQADDVIGHEFTHGITEKESHLYYWYQSGAINESLSDVFGELIDLTDGTGTDTAAVRWLIGEDRLPGGAIRDMQHPTAFNHPDRITSPLYYGGEQDAGGVHENSGVNNKAAYLMVDGDTFNGKTVTGIGIDKTADIYYEVDRNLLTSGSDYQDLYDALQQACSNLIGTDGITVGDCAEVKDAVDAVEMNVVPPNAQTVDAPVCPVGQTPTNLFFDDLESGGGGWGVFTLVGTPQWYLGNFYATSGQNSLYGNDASVVTDSVVAQTGSTALPVGTSYMHFDHAYGFEHSGTTYYDGGVVEYSINGGGTWNDAGALFTNGGYRGPIAISSNPLAGRQAFGGPSNGYGSSRLDLSSLAGQSVRFRFRIGTDSLVGAYGWFIDDVRIYTCSAGATVPGVPSGVSAVAGDGEATVSWSAPADDGGSPITGYVVTPYVDGVAQPSQDVFLVTSAPIGGLANGTTYTFTVAAKNAVGTGPESDPSNAVTPSGGGSGAPTAGDFDGDGDADLAIYRPSDGVWYVKGQPPFERWGGVAGDVPVAGDYDGDGDTDVAIYRPGEGIWYVKQQAVWEQWGGQSGDLPVPGDYDGDGDTDLAVYRPSEGIWYVKGQFELQLGQAGDVPVPADYNGDGITDPAVFRPASGTWLINDQPPLYGWGTTGDIPVPADYNGDGTTDPAVYRPSDGVWYIHNQPPYDRWGGITGDIPAPANYDGNNNTADINTYRPTDGIWYLKTQTTWEQWGGQPGDIVTTIPPATWLTYHD